MALEEKHILVRLDANHKIGLAHAIRVSSILQLLNEPYRLTVYGEGELIATYFPAQKLVSASGDDPNDFLAIVERVRPHLILVDHPRPGEKFWRLLSHRAFGIPVVAIDDEGGGVDADLIINGTVLDQYHRYSALRPQAKLLVGPKYSLVRPEFGKAPWRNPTMPSIVIVVGSGDRASDWAFDLMSGNFELGSWGKVRMIVGSAFPDLPRLRSACDTHGVPLESGISGEAMAEALSHAGIALITGGMIVYEALTVGVPAIVFPQIENLIPEAQWFAERGCIVDLGYDGGANNRCVAEAVEMLQSSASRRTAMSSSQRRTIDGRGMARAALAIDTLLSHGPILGERPQYIEQQEAQS